MLLQKLVPRPLRLRYGAPLVDAYFEAKVRARLLLGHRGDLPDFIIIGAQKSGTTSLYYATTKHSSIDRPIRKEIHYFDEHADRPVAWYRGHFPTTPSGRLTGEASPSYLFYPGVAERIQSFLPEVSLIVLLRDPVDRAISHYHHETVRGRENSSMRQAFEREIDEVPTRLEQARSMNAGHYDYELSHQSYLHRGLYANQLERWFDLFPRDQIHIGFSGDFFRSQGDYVQKVHSFLGIQPETPGDLRTRNVGRYDDPDQYVVDMLEEFFSAPNRRLEELLDREVPWDY